ncbi:MAG: ABC transporter ATP-binding protein/permease [Bifidobacteriaceae bacterium]|jgi:ATP-binding cassette subfamily B protein|nr:ABC transporter ATP-binding protein/permease [Bifidobacteriaceae bacterium]
MAKNQRANQRPGFMRGGAASVPGEKATNFFVTFRRIFSFLLRDKLRVFIVILSACAASFLAACGPKLIGNIVNEIFDGIASKMIASFPTKEAALTILRAHGQEQIADMLSPMNITPGAGINWNNIYYLCLLTLGIYIIQFCLNWISGWITTRLVARTGRDLRDKIEKKLWRLPLNYFDNTTIGEVLSKTTNDLDNITQTLQQSFSQLISSALMVVFVITMMFFTSPFLSVIALGTVIISFIIIPFVAKKAQPHFQTQWNTTGKLNGHIEQIFTGHVLVKSFNYESDAFAEFEMENNKLFKSSLLAQIWSGSIMPFMNFITNFNYVLLALVGGIRVLWGMMTIGDVQTVIMYSRQYSQPLAQISSMVNMWQSGMASAERVFELLDADEEISDIKASKKLLDVKGDLEFKNVKFSYDENIPLISNLSLKAESGKTVAIVGPTGAGKTTLVNLIMRFYDVDSGEVDLENINIKDLQRSNLRKNIGMVLQDTWLFHGTVKENLLYGLPEGKTITDKEFEKIVQQTHVDDFVRHLPNGYDTVIDNEANAISAGEKQLLTIARAFISDPTILILDEATSSVDTRTEVHIQAAMNKLRESRTSFVIAHRLSTIRDADTILVMEHGDIIEQGSHNDLVAQNGAYARLYNSQFSED